MFTYSSRQAAVPNLREIMDEEMALEASLAEYVSKRIFIVTGNCFNLWYGSSVICIIWYCDNGL